MAQAFSSMPGDDERIIGFMDDVERSIVIELLYQTSVLLSEGASEPAQQSASPADELFASLGMSNQDVVAPQDPALQRLLPDGVKDNPDAAAEFRRFTQESLRTQKLTNLEAAMKALEDGFVDAEEAAALADAHYAGGPGDDDDTTREVVLTREQARTVMKALTDVRLVLAQRLDIRTDEDAEALENSEEPLAAYYEFLTWLCESITLAVMRKV